MKLIVMIPCYNEEQTLPAVLRDIPRAVPGVDAVEILIVDDGSADRTVEVARLFGADWIVRHVSNRGLAAAFQTGLDACLRLGADIIVNTDGDNQYPQADIPRLIAPILRGEAEIVIGDRQTRTIEHFSPLKKALQYAGSWVVRQASGTRVPDAPSGFRAYSREAALRLNVITNYTYTLETIIQAGKKNLKIDSIPIRTNAQTRPSRLVRGLWDYVKKSGATIVRLYALYEPLKVFAYLGLVFLLIGSATMLRFLYTYLILREEGSRHVQSLVIGNMFIIIGVLMLAIGLLADLQASSRRLIEDVLYRVKKLELEQQDRHRLPTGVQGAEAGPPRADDALPAVDRRPATEVEVHYVAGERPVAPPDDVTAGPPPGRHG